MKLRLNNTFISLRDECVMLVKNRVHAGQRVDSTGLDLDPSSPIPSLLPLTFLAIH